MMHLRTACVLLAVSVLGACASLQSLAGDEPSADDRLTDRQLLRDATAAYDSHNAVPVVAEFPCADLCPGYTVRIIHYVLREGDTCAGIRGVEKRVPVPVLIGLVDRSFCLPRVLAEHWAQPSM